MTSFSLEFADFPRLPFVILYCLLYCPLYCPLYYPLYQPATEPPCFLFIKNRPPCQLRLTPGPGMLLQTF